jgi:nucleoside-diphosphate-sugar epimerase
LARERGRPDTRIEYVAPRRFDVESFRGETGRAQELLGWRAETDVETGVARLVEGFKAKSAREAAAGLSVVQT